MSDIRNDDAVQHGIDDSTSGDPAKGAALGGLGGVAVGAAAGSMAGPIGTVIGAVVGGLLGAGASGAAVAAVDAVDNDNTVSGVGDGATLKSGEHVGTTGGYGTTPNVYSGVGGSGIVPGATAAGDYERGSYAGGTDVDAGGHNVVTGGEAHTGAGKAGLGTGALVGGTLGAAVGGPVGAVVGGTIGSLVGGAAGDAGEAATEGTTGTTMSNMNTTGIATGTTPDVHAGNEQYAQLTGGDYATRPYGKLENRTISRTDYNKLPENDRMRVQLMEEELHVDKQVRQIGEVEIGKRVVSEQVNVPVTLEREEVIIHQRTVSGRDAAGAVIGDNQTIVVPISEEVAQVSKTTSVTGEVEVEKRMTTEQKTISDTVRHEEIDVNKGTTGRVTIEDETTNRKI